MGFSATPIPPGSYIYLELEDDNDAESPIRAYLVKNEPNPDEPDSSETFVDLASSFGTDPAQFFWLMGSCAQFHGLQRFATDGVKSLYGPEAGL